MPSLRFLLSRRWLLFAVIVALLAYATLLLGQWQWHRLTAKKAGNAIIHTNQQAAPRPVDQLLQPGVEPPDSAQYAVVSAVGTYDVSHTIVVRYQTRDGDAGVDVVVPLVTGSGTALLVDRGWVATSNQGLTDPSQVPAPPTGRVTVTGWVRQDAGGSSAQVVNASTRSISSAQIQPAIGIPVYGGFVNAVSESPTPATPLLAADPPDLSNGPHFFYALQWWFFGLLAIFGFFYLAWEEATGRSEARRTNQPTKGQRRRNDTSESPEHAAVDGQHHAGQERRSGAEQERSRAAEL